MANLSDSLRAFGVRNPEATIQACRDAGADVASGATIVTMETSGGAAPGQPMVWGHDGVDPQGCYTKGGPVSRPSVDCYLRGPATNGNRQGCGDAQLTSGGYQSDAERRGGMHLPLPNQTAGFAGLAPLQRQYGTADGFRRYNGSGPQAITYRDRAMTVYARAQAAIAGVTQGGPAPVGTVLLRLGSTGDQVRQVQQRLHDAYHAYSADVVADGQFGPITQRAVMEFQSRSGLAADGVVGPLTWRALGL